MMTNQLIHPKNSILEQRFLLPGHYSWEQFKSIQNILQDISQIKITFLDGWIELRTLGEEHETIKSMIALLLGLYFLEKKIEFIPVGSATREAKAKGASFEPDESYYIGEKKENPDFAVEVTRYTAFKRTGLTSCGRWWRRQPLQCLRVTQIPRVNLSSGSIDKLEKYKRFKISEVWFWENNQISIYCFQEQIQEYEKANQSQLLIDLDLDLLVRCVLMPSKLEAMREFNQAIKNVSKT